MALTCTAPGLISAIPQSLNRLAPNQKKALEILYLYRQKNPSTGGQVVPADTLLSQAACFDCGPSDTLHQSFAVWIQRQIAGDNGFTLGTFATSTALSEVYPLSNLPMHRLRAIELMLRCQLS